MNSTTTVPQPAAKSLMAVVLFGMYASFGMSWMGVVPLFNEIETTLNIGHSQAAWLVSIVSLAKSMIPIFAGILAARWGLSNTLRLSGILIVTGAMIPWLPMYESWLAARFLFGVGGAVWVTLMGAVTMQLFSAQQRPVINALNGVAINVGVILALWLTLPLVKFLGWQTTLSGYSILSAFFLVLLELAGPIAPAPGTAQAAGNAPNMRYLDVLKMPVTWLISLAFTGPLALYLVFNTWLPVYYQEAFGIAKGQTMQWMMWMNLWGIPAAMLTGLAMLKAKGCKPFILVAAMLLPLAAFGALSTSESQLLLILLALAGIGMFLSVSPLITLLQSQPNMNPSLIGMILGTMFSMTYILSSLVPGMVGWAYDAHLPLGWVMKVSCLLALSPLLALYLPEKQAV